MSDIVGDTCPTSLLVFAIVRVMCHMISASWLRVCRPSIVVDAVSYCQVNLGGMVAVKNLSETLSLTVMITSYNLCYLVNNCKLR